MVCRPDSGAVLPCPTPETYQRVEWRVRGPVGLRVLKRKDVIDGEIRSEQVPESGSRRSSWGRGSGYGTHSRVLEVEMP